MLKNLNKINIFIFLSYFLLLSLIISQNILSVSHDRFIQENELLNYNRKPYFKLEDIDKIEECVPVAILGGGPGALSAAIYCGRSRIPAYVFMGPNPGGQLIQTSYVENIPGVKRQFGAEIIETMTDQAINFGAHLLEETIIEIDFSDSSKPYKLTTSEGKTISALAVIIATGSSPRKLGIQGEDKYWGRGVAICALCDCTLFTGLDVAIIGGGDAAIEEATLLSSYARQITIFVRKEKMRAAESMQDKLAQYPNVKVVYNKVPLEIEGDEQVVTALKYMDTENNNKIETIPVSGVFLAIGSNPNSQMFAPHLALNKNGYIITDRHQETSAPRVFAAGDVSDAIFRQAVIASATGTIAGLNATALLKNGGFTFNVMEKLSPKLYRSAKKNAFKKVNLN